MNKFRGVVMIVLGCVAFYQGWTLRATDHAWWAYAVGVLAFGVGIWRITRKPPQPLV